MRNSKYIVCDTNVLISAFLINNSVPDIIVSWIRENGMFYFSEATFNEFEEVLHRPKLQKYLASQNGELRISNILAENATRPLAIGRRNWLFRDTPRGTQGSATCYSLIEIAKANGLEPYYYLHYVLHHIAADDTAEKLEALLPWNIKNRPATV